MAMSDVFFTPSILITLAICLILISALGLFFIQKLNQQNHKLNTMFDIVNTLAKETNEIKYHLYTGENPELGENLSGGNTKDGEPFTSYENDASMLAQNTNLESHTISMINVSSDESSDDDEKNGYDEDEESDDDNDDDEDDDDDDDEDDDEEDEDDEDEDDQESDDEDEVDGIENQDKDSDAAVIELDEELSSLPELESEIIDEPKQEGGVKNLDIVLDYKKASLTKLRELVQSKGIVDDASKMKKADILKLLESD